jgi:hypothetical protein
MDGVTADLVANRRPSGIIRARSAARDGALELVARSDDGIWEIRGPRHIPGTCCDGGSCLTGRFVCSIGWNELPPSRSGWRP